MRHVFYVKGLPRNNWDEHQQTERPQDNAVMHYTTLAIPITSMVHGPWSMFGHVLRMTEDTPTNGVMEFAVLGANQYKARKGRHSTNLLRVVWSSQQSMTMCILVEGKPGS